MSSLKNSTGVANLSLKLLVGSSNIDHTRAGKAAAPYGMKRGKVAPPREDGKAAEVHRPSDAREPIRRRDDGDETLAEIGHGYNVSHSRISRLKA